MELKVGKKIMLKKNLKKEDEYGVYVNHKMETFTKDKSQTVTINEITGGCREKFCIEEFGFFWTKDMIKGPVNEIERLR